MITPKKISLIIIFISIILGLLIVEIGSYIYVKNFSETYLTKWEFRKRKPPPYYSADYFSEDFINESRYFVRGDLKDVAGRLLACAQANDWDFVVRINGDNLFLDPQTLAEMMAIARTAVFDFITNVPGQTFPYGMSIEIIRMSFYRNLLSKMQEVSS